MDEFLKKFDQFDIYKIEEIHLLQKPNDFFEMIKKKLKESETVFIETLYMTVEKECLEIFEILKDRNKKNQKTVIILDENRAFRTKNLFNFIDENNLKEIFVFKSNESNKAFPHFIKELLSVLHSKIYIFDDEVILSGANLSDHYLRDRADRYILIKNKKFADHLKEKHFLESIEKLENQNKKVNYLNDSYVFSFSKDQEIEILKKIFENEYHEIILSTVYLNFTQEHRIIFENLKMKVITSGPNTSTFFSDKKFDKFIVDNYTLNTYEIANSMQNIELYEFQSDEFLFHCKGLWFLSDTFCIFIIGSTNFNSRSILLDTETNFMIVTKDKIMIKKFEEEVRRILNNSKKMTLEELNNAKTSLIAKCSNAFIKKYL
ncbi:CDP-diacylglycerol--glycerol-3-phosphate 3-phosphatidyltransferase [Gurleya vavrai]